MAPIYRAKQWKELVFNFPVVNDWNKFFFSNTEFTNLTGFYCCIYVCIKDVMFLVLAIVRFRAVFVISSLRSCYWFLTTCILYTVCSSIRYFSTFHSTASFLWDFRRKSSILRFFFKTSKLAALSSCICQKSVESHENYDRKTKLCWLLWRTLQTVSNNTSLIATYLIWSHSLLFSVEVNMTVVLFLLQDKKLWKNPQWYAIIFYPVLVHLLLCFI